MPNLIIIVIIIIIIVFQECDAGAGPLSLSLSIGVLGHPGPREDVWVRGRFFATAAAII